MRGNTMSRRIKTPKSRAMRFLRELRIKLVNLEAVAYAANGLDAIAFLFQLGPELFDVGINRTETAEIIVIPNGI